MGFSFGYSWGSKPLSQPWHSIALMVVGLGFASAASYHYLEISRFLDAAVETNGIVSDVQSKGDSYFPVVRFYDSDSVKHFIHSSTGSSPPAYEIGERVKVYYSKANPNDARIGVFWDLWLLVFLLGLFGVLFPIASLLLWVFVK